MANSCANMVRLTARTKTAKTLLPAIADAMENNQDWASVAVPPPAVLVAESEHLWLQFTNPEVRAHVRQEAEARNQKEYGAATLYDWTELNWGTSWVAETTVDERGEDFVQAQFESTELPPLELYATLCDLGFTVYAEYTAYDNCLGGIVQFYTGRGVGKRGVLSTEQLQDPKDPVRKLLEKSGWSIADWYEIDDEE